MRRNYTQAARLVGPLVEERRERPLADKPVSCSFHNRTAIVHIDIENDMLQWTIDLALTDERGLEQRTEFLVAQVLRLNFSALHTTAVVRLVKPERNTFS